ncbi:hypothetical protein M0802_016590 [Mischocyttarus mexicanus]|nr:hypothetical protein M0802_016590 [Mischocyttarus mexicanus]
MVDIDDNDDDDDDDDDDNDDIMRKQVASKQSVTSGSCVFPTNLTKNNCSITWDDTVLNDGNRNNSLPNLVG